MIRWFPQQPVRISNPWLAKNPTPPVPGAARFGTRGGLEVVHKAANDAALHERRPRGRHAFVVERTGRRATRCERVVADRESRVEGLLSDPGGEGRAALQHGLARERLLERQDDGGE